MGSDQTDPDMENYSMIKLIRLRSGEELIAKISKTDESIVTLKNVTILIPTQSNSIALTPFMPYTKIDESGVDIPLSEIMFTLDPVDDLLNRYKEIHGDLITPPEKRVIL